MMRHHVHPVLEGVRLGRLVMRALIRWGNWRVPRDSRSVGGGIEMTPRRRDPACRRHGLGYRELAKLKGRRTVRNWSTADTSCVRAEDDDTLYTGYAIGFRLRQ